MLRDMAVRKCAIWLKLEAVKSFSVHEIQTVSVGLLFFCRLFDRRTGMTGMIVIHAAHAAAVARPRF